MVAWSMELLVIKLRLEAVEFAVQILQIILFSLIEEYLLSPFIVIKVSRSAQVQFQPYIKSSEVSTFTSTRLIKYSIDWPRM